MACSSVRQHYREHAQRIQANQFKWPLKVSPYCCKQQQQKKNSFQCRQLSQQLPTAAGTIHVHAHTEVPRWGRCCLLAWRQLPGTWPHSWSAGRPLSPQSESGYSGLSTFRKSCPGSKPALPAATANKEPGNTAVKNYFLCVCAREINKSHTAKKSHLFVLVRLFLFIVFLCVTVSSHILIISSKSHIQYSLFVHYSLRLMQTNAALGNFYFFKKTLG